MAKIKKIEDVKEQGGFTTNIVLDDGTTASARSHSWNDGDKASPQLARERAIEKAFKDK